jgi:hypothetical protein
MLPVYYIVLPHDKKMGSPLGEIQMKKEYPKALQFFSEHRNTLANRPIHKSWDKKSLVR